MQPITIIKLGGSLLTYKDKAYSIRFEVFESLGNEIADCVAAFPKTKFILLNGAGSFGHHTVKKYNLDKGFTDTNSKFGFAKVLQDTAKLNRLLVDNLLDCNLAAISFQPSTVFYADQNGYQFSSLELLTNYLDSSILPCLYGELIVDTVQGSRVLSADTIPDLLVDFFLKTNNYRVQKVINLGSYDGVLDNQNQVIELINRQNYDTVKQHLYETQNVDVSGGMIKKIQEFLALADKKVESVIMSGLVPGNLKKYLSGQPVLGTKIGY